MDQTESYSFLLTFPLAAHEPEFIIACARHFDAASQTIKDQDGNTVISLDPKTIDRIFHVPHTLVVTNITRKKAMKQWNEDTLYCTKFVMTNG